MCVGGQKQRGEAKRKEIGLNPPKERTPQKGKLMQFFKGTTLVPTLPHTTFACVCATSFFSRFLLVFCASEILNHGASAGASIYRSDPSLYFFKTKVKSWNIANGRFHLGAPFWCVRQGWVIRGIQGKRYFLVKEKNNILRKCSMTTDVPRLLRYPTHHTRTFYVKTK